MYNCSYDYSDNYSFPYFQDSKNPDVNLQFVPDEHVDYTFSGEELAHAPFPETEYHGNVSKAIS